MLIGEKILDLAKELFPICRSITGNGLRQTLSRLKELVPEMTIHEVPSGTPVFDWIVPKEWNISDAYVIDPSSKKIIDFKKNNLHVVGYSYPVDKIISLKELKEKIHTLPEQPNAIPYITSYYKEYWGFCMTHNEMLKLLPGDYKVVIDSKITNGSLSYGEIFFPGKSKKEIFISTYVCHPSMANNELSGPCVSIFLAKWISSLVERNFSYRFVFIPETIGSLTYLSKNFNHLKENIIAGYNLSCIGDDRNYSFLPSRSGKTLADKISIHVLKWTDANYKKYSWLDRGSDERQYCAPGVDLPVASIMRTRYGDFQEYHTSLDNFDLVTASGLNGGFEVVRKIIDAHESNCFPKILVSGEPCMGKRNLYPTLSTKDNLPETSAIMNIISFCDGSNDLVDIGELTNMPVWQVSAIIDLLHKHELINKDSKFPSVL